MKRPPDDRHEVPDTAAGDELQAMAEDVFSSLTIVDWAVIPAEDDPFSGRDPFAEGVTWVPGLPKLPETP